VRTPNERRLLLDAGQLALFVAMLVDLALPWWTRTEFTKEDKTFTGWASLWDDPNLGWIVIVTAVPLGLAWWLRRTWLSTAAVAWALFVLAVVGASTAHLDSNNSGQPHAGLWVGWLLVAITALLRIADVVAAKQLREESFRAQR
jgi:hypothetical protein